VARVDMRMDEEGRIYVLEVNPLPGLTPDYSDLVLIAKASGMEYDTLIAEIMVGGLRRMRDKRPRRPASAWPSSKPPRRSARSVLRRGTETETETAMATAAALATAALGAMAEATAVAPLAAAIAKLRRCA
jgi:hypothetical protein